MEDTNIPFRGKLYNSKPIIDLKETFKLVKTVWNDMKLNSNIAQKVWAYEAQTLELIKKTLLYVICKKVYLFCEKLDYFTIK